MTSQYQLRAEDRFLKNHIVEVTNKGVRGDRYLCSVRVNDPGHTILAVDPATSFLAQDCARCINAYRNRLDYEWRMAKEKAKGNTMSHYQLRSENALGKNHITKMVHDFPQLLYLCGTARGGFSHVEQEFTDDADKFGDDVCKRCINSYYKRIGHKPLYSTAHKKHQKKEKKSETSVETKEHTGYIILRIKGEKGNSRTDYMTWTTWSTCKDHARIFETPPKVGINFISGYIYHMAKVTITTTISKETKIHEDDKLLNKWEC